MLSQKIINPNQLFKIKPINKPIVFTNGVFDILHSGHVSYLEESKMRGKTLIVALNTDESVKNLNKGENRPINNLENRMLVISALESVDFVTWFSENTPIDLINYIKPDVITKGGDWETSKIVGYKEMIAWGGEIFSIKFKHDLSTTKLINKIKNN